MGGASVCRCADVCGVRPSPEEVARRSVGHYGPGHAPAGRDPVSGACLEMIRPALGAVAETLVRSRLSPQG